ncbi:hypothetical protein BJ170DRAFT_734106 [Xylariales sp. AK1849]|nr:hypothetical protein BJ170DRAFT_734106 [Xylariales sp. AK1849]
MVSTRSQPKVLRAQAGRVKSEAAKSNRNQAENPESKNTQAKTTQSSQEAQAQKASSKKATSKKASSKKAASKKATSEEPQAFPKHNGPTPRALYLKPASYGADDLCSGTKLLFQKDDDDQLSTIQLLARDALIAEFGSEGLASRFKSLKIEMLNDEIYRLATLIDEFFFCGSLMDRANCSITDLSVYENVADAERQCPEHKWHGINGLTAYAGHKPERKAMIGLLRTTGTIVPIVLEIRTWHTELSDFAHTDSMWRGPLKRHADAVDGNERTNSLRSSKRQKRGLESRTRSTTTAQRHTFPTRSGLQSCAAAPVRGRLLQMYEVLKLSRLGTTEDSNMDEPGPSPPKGNFSPELSGDMTIESVAARYTSKRSWSRVSSYKAATSYLGLG